MVRYPEIRPCAAKMLGIGFLPDGACNWVETAVSCGYYDQAHLIRDCRMLAGITPTNLLDEDADLARHFYRRFERRHSPSKTRP